MTPRNTAIFSAAILTALVGCAHMRDRVRLEPLPPGSPSPQAIIEELASNQERLQNFKAWGTFHLESPQVAGKLRGRGTLSYSRPDLLYVNGKDIALGVSIFELTAAGSEYLLWLPRDKQVFHSVEGLQFESVPFRVAAADIVREMFLPEAWGDLRRREVRLEDYDLATQRATLLVGPAQEPRRRIQATGAPWMLTRNDWLDSHGEIRATTTYADYTTDEASGIRFPRLVTAAFVDEETLLEFRIRTVTPNTRFSPGIFDISTKLSDPQIRKNLATEQL